MFGLIGSETIRIECIDAAKM